MAIRIDGTNTTANPGITGADADTGLQFGTNELKLVTGGTEAVTVDSSQNVGIGTTSPAVDLDVSGKIRASTGILFGTDTADANTLDDYEEGTWTMGIASTGNLTSNVGTSTGIYRKVGKNVTVSAKFLLNSSSFSGHSGNVVVTGLPFFGSTGATTQINFNLAYNGVHGRHLIQFDMPGTYDYLVVCNSNVFSDPRTVSSISSGANLRYYFEGHYTLA